ncbi:hypothetical protein AUEXF2481DRAFT_76775 [Aureobasidium subglaciale EXF-2481]|uniref:Uncharacterized protein n=1 Tax=Aureobasidium subglaciale (strain EXF-2481) TaxID=1043005 RepID=A0A074ZK72_AURSE|nr:uncharacterized protein AUEXF2481DRAFT_76775 [Aureobasidium subglaciale EXF-2481]KEQ98886.1 hypothetical protein AUEXF2481DRAFT_76775 [Aureobasidium subglaciale EXF-2481]
MVRKRTFDYSRVALFDMTDREVEAWGDSDLWPGGPSVLTDTTVAQFGTRFEGHHGMQPWVSLPNYKAYQSKYGPNYKIGKNFHGIDLHRARIFGTTAAGFGAVAGIFALFFFADIPRVRKDIMQKIPILGDHFVREIAPEDNPF